MIETMDTVWLYAFSPNAGHTSRAYFTVFTGSRRGREIMATVSLSYLTTLSGYGAGALIKSVTAPFGPPADFTDFAMNSVYWPNALAVTFGLSARASEAYAQGNVYYFA